MAQVIARIYTGADKAASAASAAKSLGYGDSEVFVCGPTPGASKADFAASLAQAGMGKAEADGCADEIVKGRSVVIVHAAFGGGAKATAALDKFEPIAAPPTKFTSPAPKKASTNSRLVLSNGDLHDDPAPLSRYFNWPTLLNSPTPLSDWLNIPTLREFNSNVKLSNDPAPLSTALGLPVLSDDPTPLSTRMGWPVLKDDPTPLSNKLGWPVLKDDPAPLSNKMGWTVLKD